MLLGDLARMTVVPWRCARGLAAGRPLPLAAALVVLTGAGSAGLSLAAIAVEPATAGGRGAEVGSSVVLPLLFAGFWLIDAYVVDAVAVLMGRPSRRRRYLEVTGYAWPVLTLFAAVRLLQSAIDRGAGMPGSALGNAVGLVDFVVLAWFLVQVTIAVQAVYELPAASALAAALAPLAVVATLLMLVLVIGGVLHGVGAGPS